MPFIICEWKPTGAYTVKDSINGVLYKYRSVAEGKLRKKGFTYQYVVRLV